MKAGDKIKFEFEAIYTGDSSASAHRIQLQLENGVWESFWVPKIGAQDSGKESNQ